MILPVQYRWFISSNCIKYTYPAFSSTKSHCGFIVRKPRHLIQQSFAWDYLVFCIFQKNEFFKKIIFYRSYFSFYLLPVRNNIKCFYIVRFRQIPQTQYRVSNAEYNARSIDATSCHAIDKTSLRRNLIFQDCGFNRMVVAFTTYNPAILRRSPNRESKM